MRFIVRRDLDLVINLMETQKELQVVLTLLARWFTEIKLNNALYFYDINKISEDLAAQLLNEIYGYELVNLNREKANFPGIDLGDKTKSNLAFQVSSRTDGKKIKTDLETFVGKKYDRIFSGGMRFLVLNQESVKFGKYNYRKIYPNFNREEHVLTYKDLVKVIEKIYNENIDQFKRIKNILGIHLETPYQDSRHVPLLEVKDEKLIVNVSVGGYTCSVQGPLRMRGEDHLSPDLSNDNSIPRPFFYNHKGDIIEVKSKAPQSVIEYSTRIVNKGRQTAEIYQIYIDYGSRNDEERRVKVASGMRKSYLMPAEEREINFRLSQSEMRSALEKFNLDECVLFLRIVYRVSGGEYMMSLRPLGGFSQGKSEHAGVAILSFLEGYALTGPLAQEIEEKIHWVQIPFAK